MHSQIVFHSSGIAGYSAQIQALPGVQPARKRERVVQARFVPHDCQVRTPEGTVYAQVGDAIVTGVAGEEWPVPRASFERAYTAVTPTTMGVAGTYRRLPNPVLAAPMPGPFTVVLADGLSQLNGAAGDWLVDYGDGTLGVIAHDIFTATYDMHD